VAGYAIANLKTVEDSAVAGGFSPALEARFARVALGCEQTGISYQRLAPGERSPFFHRHGRDEEVYVVVSGSGRVRVGDDVAEVRRWDAVRVAPETVRGFAAGPDGLEFLAFGTHTDSDAQVVPAGGADG
jgi:uncharacterized cupin superfamily protein